MLIGDDACLRVHRDRRPVRRRSLTLVVVVVLCSGSVGCAGRAATVAFADEQGRVIELRAERRLAEERRVARSVGVSPSSLAPALGVPATALFRLREELSLASTAGGMFVELRGNATDIIIEIYDSGLAPIWFERVLPPFCA